MILCREAVAGRSEEGNMDLRLKPAGSEGWEVDMDGGETEKWRRRLLEEGIATEASYRSAVEAVAGDVLYEWCNIWYLRHEECDD
jgi:hypothetical protein